LSDEAQIARNMKDIEILVKIPLEKWPLRKLRKGWKDNIKVELIKEV